MLHCVENRWMEFLRTTNITRRAELYEIDPSPAPIIKKGRGGGLRGFMCLQSAQRSAAAGFSDEHRLCRAEPRPLR